MDTKIFKKNQEAVILYILISGDCHTDEIKDLLNDKFFKISLSTLYPILKSMIQKGLIKEYRFSNPDGSRRKFYTIQDKGRKLFEGDFKTMFADAPEIPIKEVLDIEQPSTAEEETTEEVIEEILVEKIEKKEKKSEKNKDYLDYLRDLDAEDLPDKMLDLNFDEPKYTDTEIDIKKSKEDKLLGSTPEYFHEENTDDVGRVNIVYDETLKNLYPIESKKEIKTENKIANNVVNDETIEDQEVTTLFDDVYEHTRDKGFNIRTSTDTNRYQGSRIKIGLVRFHTSVLISLIILAFYFLFYLITKNSLELNKTYTTVVVVLSILLIFVFLVIFIFSARHTIKDLPRFKEVLEVTLIISICAIIVTLIVSVIRDIDYKSITSLFYNIIVPIFIELCLPLFVIIQYTLAKKDYYQTFQ